MAGAVRRISEVSARLSKPVDTGPLDLDDDALVRGLRDGDEHVFNALVERWGGMMLRLALVHVESQAIAEEVVQDAWLTVLRSLDRFERRAGAWRIAHRKVAVDWKWSQLLDPGNGQPFAEGWRVGRRDRGDASYADVEPVGTRSG